VTIQSQLCGALITTLYSKFEILQLQRKESVGKSNV